MEVILTLSRPEMWILDIATYIMQKILSIFLWVEVRILLRSWKARFSHHSILPNEYVLMSLKRLEVSNRARNWNKVKNFIFVDSKLELSQLEMLIFIYKLMCQSSLIKFFILFCEFKRVRSWKECKNNILERSSSQIPK